jgi:hypothetical protein
MLYEFGSQCGCAFWTATVIFDHDIDSPSIDSSRQIDFVSGHQHTVDG